MNTAVYLPLWPVIGTGCQVSPPSKETGTDALVIAMTTGTDALVIAMTLASCKPRVLAGARGCGQPDNEADRHRGQTETSDSQTPSRT